MVSIIVPCYNYGQYLPHCLRSLEVALCGDDEVIIVDDASKENPIEAFWSTGCVKIIKHTENKGVSATINTGIRASKGDFILILSADDMLTPNSIPGRLKMFEADPDLDVIYGAMAEVHGDVDYAAAMKTLDKFEEHPSKYTVPMFRRRVFQKYGLYHEPLRSREDKELQYRLGVHAKSYG